MHEAPLIATIAAAFSAAWVLGLLTQRIGLSPIVGYLLAGVLIGPHTPGYIGDVHIAQQLAEVGVILLMFGVGLHFHLEDLLAVRGIAIPGAIGQSVLATLLAVAVFPLFGFTAATGAVIGMAISVASTVVLMRVLMDADVLESPQGHVAVGWLIVEDIFTVIVLVMIPAFGQPHGDASIAVTAPVSVAEALGVALAKLAALIGIVAIGGRRIVPWALVQVARLRSRELFTLTVLVFSIAMAAGAYFFFGASMALGAFLAGMLVAQSPVSHQAAADALPLRDAFAVLFFVSVGMLFDPWFLWERPLMVAATLAIVLIAKPLAALAIVAVLGYSARTALTVALGLAQIGEFSFILSDLARRHGLMPDDGHNALVAAAILSITVNPLLFGALPRIEAGLKRRRRLWGWINGRAEARAGANNTATAAAIDTVARPQLAIVVGYGPVGKSVHQLLADAAVPTVVIDLNMDSVTALRADGQLALFGDASNETLLEQAGIRRASHLIATLPNAGTRTAVVAAARALSPTVRILVRAHYLRERVDLEQAGATAAVFEEAEAAVALARLVLADTGADRNAVDGKIRELRFRLMTENIANLRARRVRSVMVPWEHVRSLSTGASRHDVLTCIAAEPFSRWPVFDKSVDRVVGYLLTKDLIAHPDGDDWRRLVRPLATIASDANVETALARIQEEHLTILLVEAEGRPIGLVTQEDIFEQVVGQIDDEYLHEKSTDLREALGNGAIVLDLHANDGEGAIRQLLEAIPEGRLPSGADRDQLLRLALRREEVFSTDLGNGLAIPHVRCPGLSAPIAVFGRDADGHFFTRGEEHLVYLVFLLITPSERPDLQLALLSQVAATCDDEDTRRALSQAATAAEVMAVVARQPGH